MTRDTGSSAISGRAVPESLRGTGQEPALPPSLSRCADAARARGEPVAASASRYSRFLLLEVPGPWGDSALDERHTSAPVARALARAAADAKANVLLIRRPGRQRPSAASGAGAGSAGSAGSVPRAWALADTMPEAERVLWGSWDSPDDLLRLDLTAALPDTAADSGPQRVALICTNGKRDRAARYAAARSPRRSPRLPAGTAGSPLTWEGTVSRRPSCCCRQGTCSAGLISGRPSPPSSASTPASSCFRTTVAAPASRCRPRPRCTPRRCGSATPAGTRSGWWRSGRRLGPQPDDAERWEVLVSHRAERGTEVTYLVTVARGTPSPALLSCSDESPKAEARYAAISVIRAG